MTINERIKILRTELLPKKLTMDEFGARLGVGRTSISKIESGENNVSNRMILSVCREFGVNEEWLRTGSGSPLIEIDQEEELFEAVGRLLAEKPESFRRRVVKMILSLTPDEWEAVEKKMREVFDTEDKGCQ